MPLHSLSLRTIKQTSNPNRFNALCGAVEMGSGREVPLVSESKTIHARIPIDSCIDIDLLLRSQARFTLLRGSTRGSLAFMLRERECKMSLLLLSPCGAIPA